MHRKSGRRTDPSHLPYPLYISETIESATVKAEETESNIQTMVSRIYVNAKIKEQALMDARAVLDIEGIYGKERLEEACLKAIKEFHAVTYNTLIPYIKELSKGGKNRTKPEDSLDA